MHPYFQAREAAPGLLHIAEPAGVCSTLLTGTDRALLVDTGYGFADLSAWVRQQTALPLTLLNTHAHLDHAGGNFYFSQPAWLHPAEREIYDFYQADKVTHVPYVEQKYRNGKIEDPFPPGFDRAAYLQYSPVRFRDLADHQQFDLGDGQAEVLFLPGHTKGSVAVFDHRNGTLLTGDNVGPSLWIMFPGQSAPLDVFAAHLDRIRQQYPIRQVLASHAPTPYPPRIIDCVLHAVTTCRPETSTPFTHPRHGYAALHHREPVTGIPGLTTIHVVYPIPT